MIKKQKFAQDSFAGDPDGHLNYMKQNENDAAAHHFIFDLREGIFQDTNELRNQEASHSMEFYRCMQCLKVFQSVRAFENHHVSHLSSHTCPTCGKVFQLKTSLTNHLQQHSSDRIKCLVPGCSKTFKWGQNQLEHIQWVHRENAEVLCTHCMKYFQTLMSMHTHRVNQHGTVPDITPGHPQGHPRNGASTRKPSAVLDLQNPLLLLVQLGHRKKTVQAVLLTKILSVL